jgi:hypothetical protein
MAFSWGFLSFSTLQCEQLRALIKLRPEILPRLALGLLNFLESEIPYLNQQIDPADRPEITIPLL